MKDNKFQEWGKNSKFYNTKDIKSVEGYPVNIFLGYKTSFEIY